jgi:hypothetical protein
MKFSGLISAVVLMVGFVNYAYAGPNHDLTPKHGGIVAESKEVTLELVISGDKASLYISDHGKVPNMKELKGKLTILSGSVKTEYSLTPGERNLIASGIPTLSKGTVLVASITGYQGKALNARFTIK